MLLFTLDDWLEPFREHIEFGLGELVTDDLVLLEIFHQVSNQYVESRIIPFGSAEVQELDKHLEFLTVYYRIEQFTRVQMCSRCILQYCHTQLEFVVKNEYTKR